MEKRLKHIESLCEERQALNEKERNITLSKKYFLLVKKIVARALGVESILLGNGKTFSAFPMQLKKFL